MVLVRSNIENPKEILKKLRSEFKKSSDAKKAAQMKAYMKSSMPYHGVYADDVKNICKDILCPLSFSEFNAWKDMVLTLWREAKFREERYAAIHLCGFKNSSAHQSPKALDIYEEMIVSGAWWDYVDPIGSIFVGQLLRNHPQTMRSKMLEWSQCKDMWKRRTSIICQLKAKKETDLELLYQCIEPSLDSREFFLRKAIGWALRQLAWDLPEEVLRYVKENETKLSPLSKREALKNMHKVRRKKTPRKTSPKKSRR